MRRNNSPPTDADRWFLQIKEQVVGPIPGAKVLERLLNDEITVMTRVSRDRREWAAFCNTQYFEDLVNYRIRLYAGETNQVGQMKPGGDDASQFEISQVFGLHGATDGISEQLDHARQLEELTANIQKLNTVRKEIAINRKTVVHEKESHEDSIHPDDKNVFVPAANKKKKTLWDVIRDDGRNRNRVALFGAIAITGTLITTSYLYLSERVEIETDREKLAASVAAGAKGDYARAMMDFKQIKDFQAAQNLASSKDLIALADAHMQGRDTKTSQALLARILEISSNPVERAEAYAMQGLMAAESGNLDEAAVAFEASLKQSEIFSTLHNLASLRLKQNRPVDAEPLFFKALELASKSPSIDASATTIGMFETAIRLDREALKNLVPTASASTDVPIEEVVASPQMPRLSSVALLLETQVRKKSSMEEQLRLALALSHFHLGNMEGFRRSAYELMDQRPKEKSDASSPGPSMSRLDTDFSEWRHLYGHCTEVYNRPNPNDFIAAFYAACLRRSHNATSAIPYAKYALALRPTDPVYIGLFSDLLVELGQTEDAKQRLLPGGRPVMGSQLAKRLIDQLALATVEPASANVPSLADAAADVTPEALPEGAPESTPSTAPELANESSAEAATNEITTVQEEPTKALTDEVTTQAPTKISGEREPAEAVTPSAETTTPSP